MTEPSILPSVNAALNGASTVLLLAGWLAIRARKRDTHRAFMLAALSTSAAFLVCYVVYHAQVGSVRYTGQGLWRTVYFAILVPHVVLAALLLPLVGWTVFLALRADYARHRRWARWTFPIWMYVSISGVAVYVMLYRLPHGPASARGGERSVVRLQDATLQWPGKVAFPYRFSWTVRGVSPDVRAGGGASPSGWDFVA